MFSGGAARARRFSLLLLEEEEDYVQDWVALAAWPVDQVCGGWKRSSLLPGRVRLCTRSLFFEPDDVRVPIARIPLASVKSLSSGPPVASVAASLGAAAGGGASGRPPGSSLSGAGGAGCSGPSLQVEAGEVALMRANMEDVPYTFLRAPREGAGFRWAFGPCFSPLGPLLAQAGALRDMNRRPRAERSEALEALSRQRLEGVSFDLSRLQDFGERLVWSGPVLALSPLVREWGHLAVTPARVYFQPLHNIAGGAPVKSHPLAAVAAVARRRSSLRPVGLEIFFLHPTSAVGGRRAAGCGAAHPDLAALAAGPLWDAPSAFFAFSTEAEREAARHLLTCQPQLGACVPRAPPAGACPSGPAPSGVCVSDPLAAHGMLLEAAGPWLRRVTAAWQRGAISNFDYLLYLNFAAGRSFNDLAQWPVFPWVLRNYTSASLDLNDPANYRDLHKPVGALNPARLEEFRRRYRDMPADAFEGSVPPFMYGTHYSTPGYVMYWLVRAAPSHMLRLQGGRFDAPDRLFASLQEAWEGVLSSTTDVKELIPEFFMPAWDFLTNARHLPLGVRQNGRPVGDVELPPWATDPRDFLARHRAALESPPVSRSLHAWIDLIFGYKQRGPAAAAADNVFYHLTYEGAADAAAISSPMQLKALETQVNEFGQTPQQLFTTPHPPRLVCPPAPDPAAVFPADDVAAVDSAASGAGGAGCAGSAGGGAGTGYSGEGDAGNRDVALALLATIIAAAAAPEGEAATSSQSESIPPQGESAPGAAMDAFSSPAVTAAAQPSAQSPSSPQAGPPSTTDTAAAAAAPPGPSSATSLFSSFLKLGRYQQRQQHPGSGATSPADTARLIPATASGGAVEAASPAGGAAARVVSPWSSVVGVLAGTGARRESVQAEHGSGGATLHLSGAHSEPALNGVASPNLIAGSASAAPGVHGCGDVPARGCSRGDGGGEADALGATAWSASDWGWGARCSRPLAAVACSRLTRGPLAAVASGRNGYLYCVGQAGIRVVEERPSSSFSHAVGGEGEAADDSTGGALAVVRSAQLDGQLLSLALLPVASDWAATAAPSHGASGTAAAAGSGPRHQRLMLAGSHKGSVYAYSPDAGRVVGSFDAHDDAVCCVRLMAGASAAPALVTSSWDCSVKIWSLAEGRAPWGTGLSLPSSELRDLDSGVWALATDPRVAHLLATGTEEGVVALWDTRAPGRRACCAWQAAVAQDYVGGLALVPPSASGGAGGWAPAAAGCAPAVLLAATADGALTLFDVRFSGGAAAGGGVQRLATAACRAPLRCCVADAQAALAGDESGAVQLWDVGRMAGGRAAVRPGGPAPDGLYPPWEGAETEGSAVAGLDVYPGTCGSLGGDASGHEALRVAIVTEGGKLVLLEGTGPGT